MSWCYYIYPSFNSMSYSLCKTAAWRKVERNHFILDDTYNRNHSCGFRKFFLTEIWSGMFVYACRSLFVPYFKYLIDGCVRYLTDGQAAQEASFTKKRKKAKAGDLRGDMKGMISPELWHLRSLILSSLYKCFLYDTGNLKFLESSNFQVVFYIPSILECPTCLSATYANGSEKFLYLIFCLYPWN